MANGQYVLAQNNNPVVFSFYRIYKNKKVLVVVNLSDATQNAVFTIADKKYSLLWGKNSVINQAVALKPYEVLVYEVQ